MRARLTVFSLTLLTFARCLNAANQYFQHNLVADLPGVADYMDSNLVNPWGIAFSSTGPFWIANNSTSYATVYNSTGVANPTIVAVPAHPTGIVQNSTGDFPIAPGVPSSFIFCSENGMISAWNGSVNSAAAAVIIDHSSSGAVYTGLARANNAVGPALYAVNFNAGTVEVYDANFNAFPAIGTFSDPMVPAGFVPFNVWALGNQLYVTFAMQDATKHNPVAGAGKGYVDLFDANGSLIQRVAGGAPLNAPWGLAIAPAKFGDFAGALLVGNFGDGTIDAFNVSNGALLGVLANVAGTTISIQGLWSLAAGNGASAGDGNAIYFTAGPDGETHGLFGSLQAAPVINPNGIVNGASFQLGTAPYTFISILGSNLSATTRQWLASDFVNGKLPQTLDGVSVTIDGAPAFVSYISPTQLNVLLPTSTGPGELQTFSNGLASGTSNAQLEPISPAFFQFGSTNYVAATHADGTFIGPVGMFSSSTEPARVGELITIYGTGFGVTNPPAPNGALITSPLTLVTTPTVTVGGMPAQVVFAGVTAPGLYQLNVVIPPVGSGDSTLIAQMGSVTSPTVQITVQ